MTAQFVHRAYQAKDIFAIKIKIKILNRTVFLSITITHFKITNSTVFYSK